MLNALVVFVKGVGWGEVGEGGRGGKRGYRQDRRVRENKQMTQKIMFSDFQK